MMKQHSWILEGWFEEMTYFDHAENCNTHTYIDNSFKCVIRSNYTGWAKTNRYYLRVSFEWEKSIPHPFRNSLPTSSHPLVVRSGNDYAQAILEVKGPLWSEVLITHLLQSKKQVIFTFNNWMPAQKGNVSRCFHTSGIASPGTDRKWLNKRLLIGWIRL